MRPAAIWAAAPAFAVAITSALAFAGPGGAVDRKQSFDERIDVVEVEVEVEVQDRDGRPVRGLAAAEFVVFDEGKEREIERFDEIDLALEPAAAPVAPLSTPAVGDLPVVARPRHILLLFDLTFSSPAAVTRARLAARQIALSALHPTDLVAVATFSVEYGPRLLVTFTPDRAQVARAVDSLAFDRAHEVRTLDPLRFLVPFASSATSSAGSGAQSGASANVRETIAQIGGESAAILADLAARESRRYETSRVVSWARGLGELAGKLASVAGRKQILLFSEGFDSRLLVGRSDLTDPEVDQEFQSSAFGEIWRVDSDQRYGNTPLMSESTRAIELLKRADCVLHAIDIGGMRAGEGRGSGRGTGQDGLFFLANESGGQLFTEANNLGDQMQEMLSRTATSYLLGFTAREVVANGAWRRLKVELRERKGLRVVHRAGWFAPRPYQELHPFEQELLAANAIAVGQPKNEIGLALLAAPFRAGNEAAYVPVILEIDGPSLLAGLKSAARVDLYAYATTRAGEFRAFFHRDLRVDPATASELLAKGGLKYYGHFELTPGDYVVRVLVRENNSGRTGVAMFPIAVPDYALSAATLLPPLFLDAPGRWTMIRERVDSSPGDAIVYPFVIGGDPFVPVAGLEFRAGDRPRFCLVGYNLGEAELALEAFWISDAGERRATVTAERGVSGIAGLYQWSAQVDLAGLSAGDHRVRVSIVDVASGRRVASSETTLRVAG